MIMKNTDKVYHVQEIVRDKLIGDYFLRVPKSLELTKWILVNSNRLWEVNLEDIDVSFGEIDVSISMYQHNLGIKGSFFNSLPTLVLDESGDINSETIFTQLEFVKYYEE